MKWLIASDIHGAADRCRQLLAAYMKAFARRPEHRNMAVHTDCNLMD